MIFLYLSIQHFHAVVNPNVLFRGKLYAMTALTYFHPTAQIIIVRKNVVMYVVEQIAPQEKENFVMIAISHAIVRKVTTKPAQVR